MTDESELRSQIETEMKREFELRAIRESVSELRSEFKEWGPLFRGIEHRLSVIEGRLSHLSQAVGGTTVQVEGTKIGGEVGVQTAGGSIAR